MTKELIEREIELLNSISLNKGLDLNQTKQLEILLKLLQDIKEAPKELTPFSESELASLESETQTGD